jgi:pimeloyl-ACP methyl ester carboxylesterase
MTREQWQANGFTFDVEVGGPADGQAVVLLHGFPQNAHEWDAVAQRLNQAGYRTIAPDQRGYSPGARPEGVGNYQMTQLVGDVVGLLDAQGIEGAHVVGHDWGAAVAWSVAAVHPERVRTLTALSVPHPAAFARALRDDRDQQKKSAYMLFFRQRGIAEKGLLAFDAKLLRGSFRGSGLSKADLDVYVEPLRQPGALTAALNWYRASSGKESAAVPPVTRPTTYIWSDGDIALGRTGADACGQYVEADYHRVDVPGASHWLPDTHPDQVADAILARITASAQH